MESTSSEPKEQLPPHYRIAHFILSHFSWESPNSVGAGNQFSGADTDNFLAFLRELRAQPAGANLFITAAVGSSPWIGPNGQPVTDMSGFADVLDYIAIMNYDINVRASHTSHRRHA